MEIILFIVFHRECACIRINVVLWIYVCTIRGIYIRKHCGWTCALFEGIDRRLNKSSHTSFTG